jgi:putative membrane protein
MKKLALIGAFAVFSCAAGAATVGEKTGINSTLGIAPTTADFVSDMIEIQSSQLAMDRLSGPEEDFAKMMINDHTKTSSELKALAAEAHVAVPAAMDSSHQGMLDKLKILHGDDFRKLYFSDQVSGHKDAVSLFERYGKGGENSKIKDWASSTLPTLQHHLGMAQDDYKNT